MFVPQLLIRRLLMNDRLQSALTQLRLSGLAQSLDVRLQEAAGHQLNHAEFLELVLQDELLVRMQRQIDRRVKNAEFKESFNRLVRSADVWLVIKRPMTLLRAIR